MKQIDTLYANMTEMGKTILNLTDKVSKLDGGSVTLPEADEYPAWVQPTGAHDAYNTGDKMTYTDGKRYICQMDNCVWGPDVYPAGWKLAGGISARWITAYGGRTCIRQAGNWQNNGGLPWKYEKRLSR